MVKRDATLRVFCRNGVSLNKDFAALEGAMISGAVTIGSIGEEVNVVTPYGFLRVKLQRLGLMGSVYLSTTKRMFNYDRIAIRTDSDVRLKIASPGNVFVTAVSLETQMRTFLVKLSGDWSPQSAGQWGVGLARMASKEHRGLDALDLMKTQGLLALPAAMQLLHRVENEKSSFWGIIHVLVSGEHLTCDLGETFVLVSENDLAAYGVIEEELDAASIAKRLRR